MSKRTRTEGESHVQANVVATGPGNEAGLPILADSEAVELELVGHFAIGSYDCGSGKLYLTNQRVLFYKADNSNGFSFQYEHLIVHATGTDPDHFPQPTLLMHVEPALTDVYEEQSNPEETATSDILGGSSASRRRGEDGGVAIGPDLLRATELRFAPDDAAQLETLYDTMGRCVASHPVAGSEDEDDNDFGGLMAMAAAGGGFYTGGDADMMMDAGAQNVADNLESMLPDGDDVVDGQFDEDEEESKS